MIKITCDRCGVESAGLRTPLNGIHVGEKWYDLCSGCLRVYDTIENKVIDYRIDLKTKFMNK